MPSAILSERDTAVPNRVFFSSNHPFCFLLLCFSMPHSVAYCVSIHASSWYFRHRKMMARSTVWLLRIHMMREGMARLRQHISIPGRTCRAAFLLYLFRRLPGILLSRASLSARQMFETCHSATWHDRGQRATEKIGR